MAKKNEMEAEVEKSEQMDLFDTQPEKAKEIVKAAQKYRETVARRMKLLDKEVEQKEHVLKLINECNVPRMDKGKRRLRIGNFIITTEPKDELVKIKEVDE